MWFSFVVFIWRFVVVCGFEKELKSECAGRSRGFGGTWGEWKNMIKIFTLPYHVVHGLLSVLQMVPRMALQLVAQRSEQAIAVKAKTLVKIFQKLTELI